MGSVFFKKSIHVLTLLLIIGITSCTNSKKETIGVIPLPTNIEVTGGTFNLPKKVTIHSNSALLRNVEKYMQNMWEFEHGSSIELSRDNATVNLILSRKLRGLKNDGYQLSISANGIYIRAKTKKGIFYGIQTFRQLVTKQEDSSLSLKMVEITDIPRFAYRGFDLDLCRHFYSKKEVMNFIDVMASLKMNKLCIELSDDTGWRIEIKKYPKLTEIGAWRKSIGYKENEKLGINTSENKRYGGFYTQEDIRQIVRYAKERYIDIIPQFEITNHLGAAARVDTNLVCHTKYLRKDMTDETEYTIGCLGKKENLRFWKDVLNEVSQLFPYKYIHIGSGSINYGKDIDLCDSCKLEMEKHHFKNHNQLEFLYLKEIEKHILSLNKESIVWNSAWEISNNSATTSMIWRREATVEMNMLKKHKLIWMPKDFYCFGNAQSVNDVTKEDDIENITTLKKAFDFMPSFEHFKRKQNDLFWGLSGCLWNQNAPNFDIACYRIFPRTLVVAERAWGGFKNGDWDDFYLRTKKFNTILDQYHIKHGQPSYFPLFHVAKNPIDNSTIVKLTNETNSKIFFTLDGTTPTTESKEYYRPIKITGETILKAIGLRENNSTTPVITKIFYPHKAILADVKYKYPFVSTAGENKNSIVDGVLDDYQNFVRNDASFVIDLKNEQPLYKIATKWVEKQSESIFLPTSVKYSISSDNINYRLVYQEVYREPKKDIDREAPVITCFIRGLKARYIKVEGINRRVNPEWHQNPDKFSRVSIGEVVVE